jgi:aminopeptidase N
LALGENNYAGKVKIKCEISNTKDIFVDFQGREVTDLSVNGSIIGKSSIKFSKHRVHIPSNYLNQGKSNKIEIGFVNEYVTNSAGLHKFTDPVDGNIYFYTHLEPFFCHRWFPCFDQPNIRAPLKMRVITSKDEWNVYSNDIIQQKFLVNSHIGQSLIDQFELKCQLETT